MGGLHPAALFGLGRNGMTPHQIEQVACTVAHQQVEALARLAITPDDGRWIMPGQGGDDLPVVAA